MIRLSFGPLGPRRRLVNEVEDWPLLQEVLGAGGSGASPALKLGRKVQETQEGGSAKSEGSCCRQTLLWDPGQSQATSLWPPTQSIPVQAQSPHITQLSTLPKGRAAPLTWWAIGISLATSSSPDSTWSKTPCKANCWLERVGGGVSSMFPLPQSLFLQTAKPRPKELGWLYQGHSNSEDEETFITPTPLTWKKEEILASGRGFYIQQYFHASYKKENSNGLFNTHMLS